MDVQAPRPGQPCYVEAAEGRECLPAGLTPEFCNSILDAMEVQFTADQEALIREAIASGRYQTAEDAVREAMARWEESERARIEILAALDEAESDLEAGRYRDYTESTLPQLGDELRREARIEGERH
jgi:Arc/MetJ-type ribon-helix-helix transcriptional regulator